MNLSYSIRIRLGKTLTLTPTLGLRSALKAASSPTFLVPGILWLDNYLTHSLMLFQDQIICYHSTLPH